MTEQELLHIQKNLSMLREAMGMTQHELADALGCKPSTIKNAEQLGYFIPKTALAICMIATLKCAGDPKVALAMAATFPERYLFRPAVLNSNRLDLAVEHSAAKLERVLRTTKESIDNQIAQLQLLRSLADYADRRSGT